MNLPKISASKLTTFRDCKTQYAAKYLKRLKPTTETTYSILGSAVHAGLEAGYNNEFPYTAFDTVMNKRFAELGNMPYMGYSPADVQKKGYKFLDDFDFDRLSPAYIEYEFSFPYMTIGFNEVLLGGFIDYIGSVEDRPGERVVLDFKTNKNPFSQSDVDNNWQLALYRIAHFYEFGVMPDAVGIYHIPTDTITYANLDSLHGLMGVINLAIDDLLEFTAGFDLDSDLSKCAKCSIFCALKWG